MSLLQISDLHIHFPTREGELHAVKGLNLNLEEGETLGIVGESGSGKSVSVLSLMGLLPRSARVSGSLRYRDQEMLTMREAELRQLRGDRICMIFQDPMTSLTPHMRVIDQVAEPLRIHRGLSKRDARMRAIDALEEVGIPDAAKRAYNWPHEFSGGMRQRVMIAMAMISEPELLIADEPTTALDVAVQDQILELIRGLQQRHGMAVLFISHDLLVVEKLCRRVAVMRRGDLVEEGETQQLLQHPQHPYTRGLLNCHPSRHEPGSRLPTLEDLEEKLPDQASPDPEQPRREAQP